MAVVPAGALPTIEVLPQLLAKLEKKRRGQKSKAPFYRGFWSSCAGAIRSMYHELSAEIRVELAA